MTFIWILPPPIIFAENFSYISENLTIHEPMNKPKSNKAWRIGWPIIALGWLVLSVLEFIDDEGRIFRGVIFLVFAILWAFIYFNELKKFKKVE